MFWGVDTRDVQGSVKKTLSGCMEAIMEVHSVRIISHCLSWLVLSCFGLVWAGSLAAQQSGGVNDGAVSRASAVGVASGASAGPVGLLQSKLGTPVGDFEAGELIAVVGPDHVLAGEMFPMVDSVLSEYADKMPKEQMLKLRREYVRPALKSYIPTKVMYLSFFKQMAGKGMTVAQQTDAKNKAMARGRKIFYEQRIPQLLDSNSAVDIVDLDRKLQERGFSVSIMEKQFIETVMAQQVVQMQVPEQPQILLAELRSEYDAKPEKWERPARAKWRQITVRFEKDRTREAVQEKIALLGNSIFIGGAPFESVAKQSSEGFTAAQGGVHDWTVQGSLKSEVLDKAIFTIPVRRLSSIIEDEFGMHIIEVLEREEARTVPFEESQKDLQEELRKSKREKLIKEVQDKAMDTMPIWTKWPEDIPGSRPLSEITGEATGG
jgi:parvulin-like peptidyl-prolyl isomerase